MTVMTIKLTIEYDGTDFSGWQVQPGRRTIQGEIEKALSVVTGLPVGIVGSGRTDSGVHALGQVASFHADWPHPAEVFCKALNASLPRDIRILKAEKAAEGFNARRDARRRTYRYVLRKTTRAVARNYGWCPPFLFDLEPMRRASELLIGEHDFKSFSKNDCGLLDHSSRVFDVRWIETEDDIRFEIAAERFFHHMIRTLVGTLLDVGRGRLTPETFEKILLAADRREAGNTIPARGLFLLSVDY
jgi:tRNA pseudouridine38-40 synthase